MEKHFRLFTCVGVLCMILAGCGVRNDSTEPGGEPSGGDEPPETEDWKIPDGELDTYFEFDLKEDGNYKISGFKNNKDKIELPSSYHNVSVDEIGENAFSECDALTNIKIPDGYKTISDGAFYLTTNLESIVIGNSVTSIGQSAISVYSSTKLKKVILPNNLDYLGVDFDMHLYSNLEKNTFGNSYYIGSQENPYLVLVDNKGVIDKYTPVTEITIHPECKFIAKNALYLNAVYLTSLEIPLSVKSFDLLSFCGCGSVEELNYLGTIEDWNNIRKDFPEGFSTTWNYGLTKIDSVQCSDGIINL